MDGKSAATASVVLGMSGLQIARLERRAFPFADAETVPEIAVEIAVISADRIEASGRKEASTDPIACLTSSGKSVPADGSRR